MGDAQAVMDFMMAYLPGWIGYMVYVLFILAVVITGIVLFIVFRKRFALDRDRSPKDRDLKQSSAIPECSAIAFSGS